jgi:hypothetical protein
MPRLGHKRSHAVVRFEGDWSTPLTSALLGLPRELREKVWDFAMADELDTFTLAPGMKTTPFFLPKSLPPSAFVRRSLFSEIFLIWVRARTLAFHFNAAIPIWFVWWMDNIAEGRAWANIKSRSFTAELRLYQTAFTPNFDIFNAADFVVRATTLRHLTLTISSLSVTHFDPQSGFFTHVKPVYEVLFTLDFTNVLRCEHLQTLMLHCCPTWKDGHCVEAEDLGCRNHDMFMPLLRWFIRGFKEQDRTVKVHGKLDRRGKKWSEEKVDKWRV